MIKRICRGEICDSAELGDLVFWVHHDETGGLPTYQHAALLADTGPILIASPSTQLNVYEFIREPKLSQWPGKKYRVQVIGKMQVGRPTARFLNPAERLRIKRVASSLAADQDTANLRSKDVDC